MSYPALAAARETLNVQCYRSAMAPETFRTLCHRSGLKGWWQVGRHLPVFGDWGSGVCVLGVS
jgi:hypothetical protein